MARKGPYFPRRDSMFSRARQALESAAYQVGVIVAFERIRADLTQQELADELGVRQIEISEVERGVPTRMAAKDIEALFERLGLDGADGYVDFLQWWKAIQPQL